ncbi:uncharacterized protein Z518_08101 [Rhinocladiella mackenziei CBS 650.93]|uniref:DNA mismatch repair protein PMS1 n=1 Tax=Rhinocladiella mackenziei CBS 650.93 TaxID=1442369 RepID=A0A0D2FJN9_9EURO|nr:uncharacterized protein Z518_08101 [Rhinocladiella mackenziei CBS 650.93]KIX02162.1 hypothetical protein Z518_08101 [Rhinocladiella mackenziei CBS 650.93]
MATIKAIEAKSVHQIQSGQVIVDLCSVAKELVENSLDAGATSVEIRFKNNGLDSIEVQDNGSGIAPANYENVARKHYTSKLSSYDDLSSLQTFGFRGEALSSLCALSKFSMTTAQAHEAPKGKHLDFDALGQLKSTTIVASQKGTTATVENLFENLPVRRKELIKNIKREYGKVLGLLHAYACICVNVKFTVKNAMPKGKSLTVFSTKANATTRENIANVYGAKTLAALVPLDLKLHFPPTLTQMARKDSERNEIHIKGHISKPVFGEGRQTPDRQMFFVNGRPCGLPQIAKAVNEVYKGFNVSQSPFIFADLQMDTNAYDVNVSPDKRTILLHDSAALIENLKSALNDMFDQQDQTVPQSHLQTPKLPAFQNVNFSRQTPLESPGTDSRRTLLSKQSMVRDSSQDDESEVDEDTSNSLMRDHFRYFTSTREEPEVDERPPEKLQRKREQRAEKIAQKIDEQEDTKGEMDEYDDLGEIAGLEDEEEPFPNDAAKIRVRDFNQRMSEAQPRPQGHEISSLKGSDWPSPGIDASGNLMKPEKEESGAVPNAFDRMRPKRVPVEPATVTIGDKTITTILGTQFPRSQDRTQASPGATNVSDRAAKKSSTPTQFSQKLRQFGARATQISDGEDVEQGESTQNDFDAEEDSDPEQLEGSQSDSSEGRDGSVDDPPISPKDVEDESDCDYVDEEEKKKKIEEARVAELIRAAEENSPIPSKDKLKRVTKALSGGRTTDSTANLLTTMDFSLSLVAQQMGKYTDLPNSDLEDPDMEPGSDDPSLQDAETRLSLTVSKGDFAHMDIVGQFNLGFILAVRPGTHDSGSNAHSRRDELFIIDQHASDEKYNFERLQAETVVGNQRLVRPAILDLTAVEEEIVLENNEALEKNGFLVEIDTSGDRMVGQRCSLISLPLSKEVVFNTRDLEELIQLLAEAPGLGSNTESAVPRPSKVRKMFAMRACRSSIMIGKTLSKKQMEKVVAHMGTIGKPWNCPHGRPTMRHLCSLNTMSTWHEGEREDGVGRIEGLGEALQRYASR